MVPESFFESVLDAIVEQLAVIDSTGKIVFVNQSWKRFGIENGGMTEFNWKGVNYLDSCIRSAECGDDDARTVVEGIDRMLSDRQQVFSYEYPCHSENVPRWFLMRMAPVPIGADTFFVITHHNITERKLAEEALAEVATKDALTNIPNRRKFAEFSEEKWKLGVINKSSVSIAMIDIDHFKSINDRFGHSCGDICLIELANILESVTRRSNDLCARYGGEEFIIFLSDTTLPEAVKISERIIGKLRNLDFSDHFEGEAPFLRVSIGVASTKPNTNNSLNILIQEADDNLYKAKRNGRDRVIFNHQQHMRERCTHD